MRNILKILLIAVASFFVVSPASAGDVQTSHDFYRNPSVPLEGTPLGCCWKAPGAAFSANAHTFHFDQLDFATIESVRWVLVWNPNSGPSDMGVRLVYIDDVNGDENQNNFPVIAEIRKNTDLLDQCDENLPHCSIFKPKVSAKDITVMFKNLLQPSNAVPQRKHILQQTFGNGVNGALIYSSTIEIIWK